MAKQEHERRYLAIIDPLILNTAKKQDFVQGYLEQIGPKEMRIRIIDNKRAILGTKKGRGKSRLEAEKPISLAAAKLLLTGCTNYLEKTRFFPPEKTPGGKWTIDVLRPPLRGIIVIEFEHEYPEQEVVLPGWVKNAVEVTDSLSSHHLARIATELRNTGAKINPDNYEFLIQKRVPKIVLTGGPCSGKSGLMEIIKKKLGQKVQCVPEVTSILIDQMGIRPFANHHRFTLDQYRIQMILEATSEAQAANEGKSALILDRGNPDAVAYTKKGWTDFCAICHTEKEYELERYQAVICLDVPGKDIYEANKGNNPARSESWEEAVILGKKTQAAWQTHPNFHIVENCISWEEKEKRVLEIIQKFLGQ